VPVGVEGLAEDPFAGAGVVAGGHVGYEGVECVARATWMTKVIP
jgi:hypothetical protein